MLGAISAIIPRAPSPANEARPRDSIRLAPRFRRYRYLFINWFASRRNRGVPWKWGRITQKMKQVSEERRGGSAQEKPALCLPRGLALTRLQLLSSYLSTNLMTRSRREAVVRRKYSVCGALYALLPFGSRARSFCLFPRRKQHLIDYGNGGKMLLNTSVRRACVKDG